MPDAEHSAEPEEQERRDADPAAVFERLNAALNNHDIEAFVGCFHDDYESAQPAHPDRAFTGSEQARINWSQIFEGVPDFSSELLRTAAEGDTAWSEWHWQGTHADESRLEVAGVIIAGIRDDRIAWARLYVEPVEQEGAGIERAVGRMAGDD
jgi:ketosteroid isomerase-like protein